MSIAMEIFGMTEQPAKFGASIEMPGHLFPYRLQCRACGFEPLDAIVPPPRCPKCAAGAWERLPIPRSLLMNATRQFPRGRSPFQSARNAALEGRIRRATEESVL
jgi:rubredoxin